MHDKSRVLYWYFIERHVVSFIQYTLIVNIFTVSCCIIHITDISSAKVFNEIAKSVTKTIASLCSHTVLMIKNASFDEYHLNRYY